MPDHHGGTKKEGGKRKAFAPSLLMISATSPAASPSTSRNPPDDWDPTTPPFVPVHEDLANDAQSLQGAKCKWGAKSKC